MQKVLASLLASTLLMVAIAGCTGTDGGGTGLDTDLDHKGADGNETASGPNATIAVTIDGNETSPVNGSIPATAGVNITFDGSGSTGQNLTFAWDFGDNATGDDATVVHAFAAPGAFTVSLTVTQGNATSTAQVTLNVSAAGPAAGTLIEVGTQEFKGTITGMDPNSCNTTTTGQDCKDHPFTIAGLAPSGAAALAKGGRLKLSCGTAVVWCSVYLRGPDGATIASGVAQASSQNAAFEAELPPGEYSVRVRTNVGANNAYTATLELDYYAA